MQGYTDITRNYVALGAFPSGECHTEGYFLAVLFILDITTVRHGGSNR